MNDQDLEKRLTALEQKVEATYQAANKTRKYILWTIIIAIVVTVLPLIGLGLVIPKFLSTLSVYKMF